MKVRTNYDPKPGPTRDHDWTAIDDNNYDPGRPIGYGRTEAAAVRDLMAQLRTDWTREEFEAALDAGVLQTRLVTRAVDKTGKAGMVDKWYTCRRNGRTKTWKRDASRFEIPIKFRFRDCMRVLSSHFADGQINAWFRITEAQ